MNKQSDEIRVRIIGEPTWTPENRKRAINALERLLVELDKLDREDAMKKSEDTNQQKTVLRDGK